MNTSVDPLNIIIPHHFYAFTPQLKITIHDYVMSHTSLYRSKFKSNDAVHCIFVYLCMYVLEKEPSKKTWD